MDGSEQLSMIIPMLKGVADHIRDDQFGSVTPCAAFDVAGVLGHMTGLATGFAPMFRGESPPQSGSTLGVTTATGQFKHAMDELLAAVTSPGALERTIQPLVGRCPEGCSPVRPSP